MRVWVDLSNSPHPLLFSPVVRRLEQRGHEVLLTARDNAQTVELARERWSGVAVIGGQSPAGRRAKAAALLRRIRGLGRWARALQPQVALSHNSYAQIVAARTLGLPIVTAMDFEHQPANHLAFRLANRILMPQPLAETTVRRQGASPSKSIFYPGLKEELYLGDFEPNSLVTSRFHIDGKSRARLVVARTPPDRALYHRHGNSLFTEVLRRISADEGNHCVVLARDARQRASLEQLRLPNVVLPSHAVDSRSLMYEANLVVGAGGTMTREAALFGVPTMSVFAGRTPMVDQWLLDQGLMTRLHDPDQLEGWESLVAHRRPLEALRARSDVITELFLQATVQPREEPIPAGRADPCAAIR